MHSAVLSGPQPSTASPSRSMPQLPSGVHDQANVIGSAVELGDGPGTKRLPSHGTHHGTGGVEFGPRPPTRLRVGQDFGRTRGGSSPSASLPRGCHTGVVTSVVERLTGTPSGDEA